MSREPKKKKPKVTYVDDGRSLADMGGLNGEAPRLGGASGSYRDRAKTFFAAMRMMFVPMLITLGIITLAFALMWVMLKLAA